VSESGPRAGCGTDGVPAPILGLWELYDNIKTEGFKLRNLCQNQVQGPVVVRTVFQHQYWDYGNCMIILKLKDLN